MLCLLRTLGKDGKAFIVAKLRVIKVHFGSFFCCERTYNHESSVKLARLNLKNCPISTIYGEGNGEVTEITTDSLEAIFALRGPLASQSPEFRTRMLGLTRWIEFDRGDRVINAGDAPGGIYGVVRGSVGAWTSTDLVDPVLGHILRPGSLFSNSLSIPNARRLHTFETLEETVLILAPRAQLLPMLLSEPDFMGRMGVMSHLAGILAQQWATELLIREPDKRIAATLLRVTAVREGIKPTDPRGFQISQAQLAEMSNTSRVQTGDMLGRLKKLGLITSAYGHIDIPQPEALADYVRNSD